MKITRLLKDVFVNPLIVHKDTRIVVYPENFGVHDSLMSYKEPVYEKILVETGFFKVGDVLSDITYFEGIDYNGKEVRGLMITTPK